MYLHVISKIQSPIVFKWSMSPVVSLSCPVSIERVKSPKRWGVLLFKEPQVPLKQQDQHKNLILLLRVYYELTLWPEHCTSIAEAMGLNPVQA